MQNISTSGLQIPLDDRTKKRQWMQGLLPVLLFAVLFFSLGSMMELPFCLSSFLLGIASAIVFFVLQAKKMVYYPAVIVLFLLSFLLFLFCTPILDGAKMFLSCLFDASASVNRYTYIDITPHDTAQGELHLRLFRMMLGVIGGAVAVLVLCGKKLWSMLVFAVFVSAEVYFGIVPTMPWNLLLFLALVLALVRHPADSFLQKNEAVIMSGVLVASLIIVLCVPGVHAKTEAYSESLRDFFAQQVQSQTAWVEQNLQNRNLTHKENRLKEIAVNNTTDETQNHTEFHKNIEAEQKISRPKTIHYRKIIAILLLIVALFLVPFLPFWILDKRKQRAVARRANFDATDCATAIQAMFPHIVNCLTAFGVIDENDDFSALPQKISVALGTDFARRYLDLLPLWQEAEYSNHPIAEAKKQAVQDFLHTTEREIFTRANRKLKFRLRFIDCLIVPEEIV